MWTKQIQHNIFVFNIVLHNKGVDIILYIYLWIYIYICTHVFSYTYIYALHSNLATRFISTIHFNLRIQFTSTLQFNPTIQFNHTAPSRRRLMQRSQRALSHDMNVMMRVMTIVLVTTWWIVYIYIYIFYHVNRKDTI